MAIVLGIDLGTHRIGLALSDEGETIAFPHETIAYRGREFLAASLRDLVVQYKISRIVVGLPKTLRGDMGPAALKTVDEVDWLKTKVDAQWILWDERLSTQEIERLLREAELSPARRKGVRDQLAAQRILQNYLDHSRNLKA